MLRGTRGNWKSHMLLCVCACVLSHVRLCDPRDCGPPGSSVHGVLQARTLEWIAISYSREPSWPRDRIHISCVSCIGRRVLDHWHNLGSPSVADGNENWCSSFKNSMVVFWKVKHVLHAHTHTPYRPAILFLGIYPRETKTMFMQRLVCEWS